MAGFVEITNPQGVNVSFWNTYYKPIPSNATPANSSELQTWSYWRAKTGDFTDAGAGRISQLNDLGGVYNVLDGGVITAQPLYRTVGFQQQYNEIFFITDDILTTTATNINFPQRYIFVSVLRTYGNNLLYPLLSVDTGTDVTCQGAIGMYKNIVTGGVRLYSPGKNTDFQAATISTDLQLVVIANPFALDGPSQLWVNGFPMASTAFTPGQSIIQGRPVNIGGLRLASAWQYSVNGFGLIEQFVIDIASVAFTGKWREYVDGLNNFYLAGGYPISVTGQPQLYRYGLT